MLGQVNAKNIMRLPDQKKCEIDNNKRQKVKSRQRLPGQPGAGPGPLYPGDLRGFQLLLGNLLMEIIES